MSELELQDRILRHALQILRVSAGEQAAIDEIMRQLDAELRALLGTTALSEASRKQVTLLIEQADKIIGQGYVTAAGSVDTHALALVVAQQTADLVGEVIPREIRTPALASFEVLIEGAPSADWWARQGEDLAFRFAGAVRQGLANNETQEQIVARITGRRGEPGLMDMARRNARALVHSSVMSAANEARLATFRKNSRFIKGVRWLATLDGHTCTRCAALDHQAWDLEGKPIEGTTVQFMAPPIHWNDRCVLTPIPKTFRDIGLNIPEPTDTGQRASSNGPVAGNTTFTSFLKRQSPDFIEQVLGKKRAELFKAGKITTRDLISGTGRELTLDELKAL